MRSIIIVFLMALALTLSGTPWVRRMAIWLGFVDLPATRKLHKEPMPLMGGVAIVGAALVALVILIVLDVPQLRNPGVQGVFLAGLLVALIGLVDDRLGLPARLKFAGLAAAAAILIAFDIRVKLPIPEILNYSITFFWVVGLSNALNFLDNMDGLTAGLSAVSAAFMVLAGATNGQILVSGLAAAVLGASLGFLRYNFKPARIFMGDVGALFLGFVLAVLGLQLRFPNNSNFVTWMVPVLIMGVPIFDMTLVVFSRLRRGVSPNTAGKDHTSHRLVNMGYSQREAVLILYLINGVFGMAALFITQADIGEGFFVGGVIAVVCFVAILRLDRPEIRDARSS